MAATSRLLRLKKAPLHALIQNNLLRPSLAAGTAAKLFDISAGSQLPAPNSASSNPLIGAEFQWNLPFGMSTLPAMELSRIEVRGRAVTPDGDEYEDSDDGEDDNDDDLEDADLNDLDECEVEDFSDDADYEEDGDDKR